MIRRIVSLLLVLSAFAVPATAETDLSRRLAAARWDARDLEGRWVVFARDVAEDPRRLGAWCAELVRRQDFELLEWITLYHAWPQAGRALADADAPCWIRDAVWALNTPDSHTFDGAAGRMLQDHPAVALAWIEAHPEVRGPNVDVVLDLLRAAGPPEADVSRYLPPLQAAEVLRYLQAPPELQRFGDAIRAAPDRVYREQVLRAIEGFVLSGIKQGPWVERAASLLLHPDPDVRRATCLGLSRAQAPAPLTRLLYLASNPLEAPAVREAALLAFTRGHHPAVTGALLTIAEEPSHPAWRAALARLGDADEPFLAVWPSHPPEDEEGQGVLAHERARVSAASQEPDRVAGRVARAVVLAAWLADTGHPAAAAYRSWLVSWAASYARTVPEVEAELREMVTGYTDPHGTPPAFARGLGDTTPASRAERVRRLAEELLIG